jgi:hypothetical protein
MARLGRLERPTLCSGGTRSIQLSYRRAEKLRQIKFAEANKTGQLRPVNVNSILE